MATKSEIQTPLMQQYYAAKAQYQKFFEKYMPLVKEKGICIVDNLDFHGMIFDIDHIKNRNTKQLVKKIKRFKAN